MESLESEVTLEPCPKKQKVSQPSSSELPPGETYEVFLNFRGKDTRTGFTDHLYNGLVDAGVCVFRDDEALPVGESIGPELLNAIKGSKISITIISKGYASSKWCLRELVQILECKRTANQIVLPIFYKVEPSNVKHLTGRFGKAFASIQHQHTHEVIEEWKTALREVGSLKGWESKKIANGHEGVLVRMVIRKVLSELKKAFLVVSDRLVGLHDHVSDIMAFLDPDFMDVRVLGIYGIGGIGKTTLAKVIFNKLCEHFEHCSFLADIRSTSLQHKGLEGLQKQLVLDLSRQPLVGVSNVDEGINVIQRRLRGKKVLILLDDVDKSRELDALVRKLEWLGLGSRLIITTRRADVVSTLERRNNDARMPHPVNIWNRELNELDFDLSFLLFSRHAFRRDYPIDDYVTLSMDIVSTTGGLPLAIEIIASFLCDKSKVVWEDTLKKLQLIPDSEVKNKLRISYEALDYEEKQIFLDIACLPIQKKRDYAVYMWDDCSFFPRKGIEVLSLRSLVKVGEDNDFSMHDQLRDLGREIVREECYEDPNKRSRLWHQEEALDVLKGMQGTRKVQALCLDFEENSKGNHFTSEHFQKLTRLRFLQMNYAALNGDFVRLFQELRWLQWEGCSLDFKLSNFHPTKLVVLDLSHSKVTHDWGGWKQIKLAEKLKVLKLEHCVHLIMSPNFSPFMKLEILILEDCRNLEKIDESIGDIKTLVTLNLRGCYQLKELPARVGQMKSLKELLLDETSIETIPISEGSLGNLEILSASRCSLLVQLPSSIRHLTSLSKLDLNLCENLTQLPDSIGFLERLSSLSLDHCVSLTKIPESIGMFKSLTEIHLAKSDIKELPDSIGDLGRLEVLDIRYSSIESLPDAIGKLANLKVLDATDCQSLQISTLSELTALSSLECLQLEGAHISMLPKRLCELSVLKTLKLKRCRKLQSLPELPCGLTVLSFSGDSMEDLPNISNLTNLKDLEFADASDRRNRMVDIGKLSKLERLWICKTTLNVNDLGTFSELKMLKLEDVNIGSLPIEIKAFSKLRELYVKNCEHLDYIPELPLYLVRLDIRCCPILKKIANLSNLKHLSMLELLECPKLMEITGLEGLESLHQMEVSRCKKSFKLDGLGSLKSLWELSLEGCHALVPDLSDLENLTELHFWQCKNLVYIQGLNRMKSLEFLDIIWCTSIEEIDDLLALKALKSLTLDNCPKLRSVGGIEESTSLQSLSLVGCKFMVKFPDLSKLRDLQALTIGDSDELAEIPGLEKLKSLRELNISNCKSLESLPDFSTFPALEYLSISGCEKLKELQGLESLESSCAVHINEDTHSEDTEEDDESNDSDRTDSLVSSCEADILRESC